MKLQLGRIAGYAYFGLVDLSAHAAARVSRAPVERLVSSEVEVIHDIQYLDGGLEAHTLDLFRPRAAGPHPLVMYIHGGAFFALSKDTHWGMALALARRGCLVANINYRMAPDHPFPAAQEDCAAAYTWLARNADSIGGDADRFALVGESAGGNLVAGLALCASHRRAEPWAVQVFDSGLVPRVAVPLCGMLRVRGIRERRPNKLPFWFRGMRAILDDYLPSTADPTAALADPLLLFEAAARPARPLPRFFLAVGTADPLLEDTERLHVALERMGVPVEAHYYPGEDHVFFARLWRRNTRACWRSLFAFLETHQFGGARSGPSHIAASRSL